MTLRPSPGPAQSIDMCEDVDTSSSSQLIVKVCRCAAFEFLLKHYQQRTFDQAVSQAKSQSFNDIAEYFVTQARWQLL